LDLPLVLCDDVFLLVCQTDYHWKLIVTRPDIEEASDLAPAAVSSVLSYDGRKSLRQDLKNVPHERRRWWDGERAADTVPFVAIRTATTGRQPASNRSRREQ
jgi:hypothetical protein